MTPSLKAIVERCGYVDAYDMPRLYEHMDRVELWILAQKKRQDKLMPIILELLSIAEERGKALEYYANRNGEYDWPADAKECLASTTKRLEQLKAGNEKT